MIVSSESLDHSFELPERPERVVSLTSGATEALFAIQCGESVAGVSEYCSRYVPNLAAPVVGDYLRVDESRLAQIEPDLVLVTTGVQRTLGMALAKQGFPVYALPVPSSLHGILDNILTVSALMNALSKGPALVEDLTRQAQELKAAALGQRPTIYVELWFGRHLRTIGGRTFIHDIVSMAGADPLFGERREAYFEPNFEEVAAMRPDLFLFFSEPEYPIDIPALMEQRGWNDLLDVPVIESTIECGRNVIHDGPSCVETSGWLREQIGAATATRGPQSYVR